jgi:hypothetical protein
MPLRPYRPALLLAILAGLAACATSDNENASLGPAPATTVASPAPATTTPATASYAIIKGEKAEVPVIPMGDPATIARLLDEGKNRNRVMQHLEFLSLEIGPRLTGSTRYDTAAHWANEQFKSWGLDSALWEWGTIPVRFDRGPSTAKAGILRERDGKQEFSPQREFEFTALAWSAGTDGPVRGHVIKMPQNPEEFDAIKDKVQGAWILVRATNPGDRRGVTNSMSARQNAFREIRDRWLQEGPAADAAEDGSPIAQGPAGDQPTPAGIFGEWHGTAKGGPIPDGGAPFTLTLTRDADDSNQVTGTFAYPGYMSAAIEDVAYDADTGTISFNWQGPGGKQPYSFTLKDNTITGESPRQTGVVTLTGSRPEPKPAAPGPSNISMEERLLALQPAGWISPSGDERVRTSSIRGWRELHPDTIPVDTEIQVRRSDYDYMNSRLADGAEVWVEANLQHTFRTAQGGFPQYNVIAEIKGSLWPDEVVIISAHLDSWDGPGSQGTTDNGTGSAVTLETARILAAAKAKPKRTIRFILWGGEEQGLLGSREYVRQLKESGELQNISAVFVDDGGTNYQGGLHCAQEMVPYLAAATAPVNGQFFSEIDGKFLDVNIQPTGDMMRSVSGGSSDHASFNREGIPGFFWQEVGRADYFYGWHTQHDKIDLAIPEYLRQSSTCSAITAYNLANAPALLPRPARSAETEQPQGERPQRNREGGRQAPQSTANP